MKFVKNSYKQNSPREMEKFSQSMRQFLITYSSVIAKKDEVTSGDPVNK